MLAAIALVVGIAFGPGAGMAVLLVAGIITIAVLIGDRRLSTPKDRVARGHGHVAGAALVDTESHMARRHGHVAQTEGTGAVMRQRYA